MLRLLYLLSVFVLLCTGSKVPKNHRIVGGGPADISEAPYQVALLKETDAGSMLYTQACGGAVITPFVIVSAAHCGNNTVPNQWIARAGSTFSLSGGQVHIVEKIIVHPKYSDFSDYDVALFVLEFPYQLTNQVVLIKLPQQDEPIADGTVLVTGWGATQEGGAVEVLLQQVALPLIKQELCVEAYKDINEVTPRMVCAGVLIEGGKDACIGDSGGPMARNGVLLGVVSWGRGCGRPGLPGVYSRMASYRNWIDKELESIDSA